MMNLDTTTLIEIMDYVNSLDEKIGLKPETIDDIQNAINKYKSELPSLDTVNEKKQKFTKGQNVTILSGEKPLHTTIKFVEWDKCNNEWKYYFDDETGKQWFGWEYEIETR